MDESNSEINDVKIETTEETSEAPVVENENIEEAANHPQEPEAEPEADESEDELVTESSSISEGPATEEIPLQEALQVQMNHLESKMDDLLQLFQERLQYDQHKDMIYDRQYQELEGFRNGMLDKLHKPIIMDIISEIDDFIKLGNFYVQKKEEYSTEKKLDELEKLFDKLLKLYLGVVPSLCDLLEKHDVTSWQTEPGAPFDPRIHTVLKKTVTEDPELNKTICKSMRFGFKLNDKIIRREMVDVFVLQNPSSSATSSTSPLN